MKILNFFLFWLLFMSQFAFAQWVSKSNGLPSPQDVGTLTSNSSYLFAGLDGNGVYRSTDNGDNWTAVNTGLYTQYVKNSIMNGSNLFVGTIGGVNLSTNNGTNWIQRGAIGDAHSFVFNGTNFFTGCTNNGVFLSTNNGVNWTQVNNGLTNLTVYSLLYLGTNLFAGTEGGGVFLSTNNGTNWTAVNNGLTNQIVHSLASIGTNIFAATYGGGVFLSTNNGGNWNAVNTGLTNLNTYSLFSVETNLFVGTYSGTVFLSTNYGGNWTSVSTGLNTTNTITSFWVSNNYIYAAVHNGGVYRRLLSEIISLAPSAPTLLSPVNNSIGISLTPTLFWNAVTNATSYSTQVSTNTGFTNIIDSATVTTNQRQIPSGKLSLAATYYWRVNAKNTNGTSSWSDVWNFTTLVTGIQKQGSEIPDDSKLYNNYPNPFNPETNIRFDIPKSAMVRLSIYDMLGKEIEVLVNEKMEGGSYNIKWDAKNLSSGVYYCKLVVSSSDGFGQVFSEVKKMLLLK